MEFLMVYANDRGSQLQGIPVLINGQRNGHTGDLLKVDHGILEVSADFDGAETAEVAVIDTTPKTPCVVCINHISTHETPKEPDPQDFEEGPNT